jgi:hypothetical protein
MKLTLTNLQWLKPLKVPSDAYFVEIVVDQAHLRAAIPDLRTPRHETRVYRNTQPLNMELDYQVMCDSALLG